MAEPLNATFFTLKHRDRAVLLPATLAFVVILLVLIAAWAAMNWHTFMLFVELFRTFPDAPSETVGMEMFTGMMGLFLSTVLMLFPIYVATASYEAACLRWMIRGESPGFFGLTLDHDTWRVYGVYWCWFVTNLAISTVAGMLMWPVMFMMMGDIVTQVPNEPDQAALWELQIKMQALSLIQYIPMIFIGVRFAPAAATSIARRRFSFFEAWTVTSDRFWSLLGSFVLIWLLAGVVIVATSIPTATRVWPYFEALWRDPGNEAAMRAYFEQFFAPEHLIWIPIGYGVTLLVSLGVALLSYGVNARAALVALEEGKIQPVTE